MQLTTDQRLKHLEREAKEQADKIKLLHREIKEDRAIVKELLLSALVAQNTPCETKEGNPAT
jgi:hypothetical protein